MNFAVAMLASVCLCGEAPERANDFFWENDRIGFRAYGPGDLHRWSGIDVFNKATPENYVVRLLRERGKHGNWHKNLNGKCFDNYTVGAGRGVGAVAVRGDGEWKTYPNWERCAVVTNCDDFCEFRLEYPAFSALGRMTYHVTLRRGEPFFRNDVSFEHPERMVGGFVAGPGIDLEPGRDHKGALVEEPGLVSLFEDPRGEDGSTMSAILVADASAVEVMTDHMNCRVLAFKKPGFTYWAGALWSKAGHVETPEAWIAAVRAFREDVARKDFNQTKKGPSK